MTPFLTFPIPCFPRLFVEKSCLTLFLINYISVTSKWTKRLEIRITVKFYINYQVSQKKYRKEIKKWLGNEKDTILVKLKELECFKIKKGKKLKIWSYEKGKRKKRNNLEIVEFKSEEKKYQFDIKTKKNKRLIKQTKNKLKKVKLERY